jgi:hydrogenase-1 operon protein HyaF
MPFAPGEEQELETKLGQGEVRVEVSALGPSEIRETAFPGVWMVTHFNNENEILGKFIEVTYVPGILKSQTEDIRDGLARLEDMLNDES